MEESVQGVKRGHSVRMLNEQSHAGSFHTDNKDFDTPERIRGETARCTLQRGIIGLRLCRVLGRGGGGGGGFALDIKQKWGGKQAIWVLRGKQGGKYH